MIPIHLAAQVAIVLLGPLQFGVHMTELNAPLPYMKCSADLAKDCIHGIGDGSRASSAFALGGLIGSLVGGPGADRWGRKPLLNFVGGFFFIGSLIAAFSGVNQSLVAGRFVSGIAAGISIVVAPMFISEISPQQYKGALGVCTQISVNSGIVLVQFCGTLWASVAWRRIIWVGPICALVQLISLPFAVESPRWLLARGRVHDSQVASEWLGIEVHDLNHTGQHAQVSIKNYFKNIRYRHSLLVSTGIMALQQFSGINAIIFYGVTILKKSVDANAEAINFVLSLLNFCCTLMSARWIDRLGRRRLLVLSLSGIAIGDTLLGFSLIENMAMVSIFASTMVIASFGLGLGPIPFMLIGEQTPSDALGVAQSVGTTCNWIATFIIGAFFPTAEKRLGPGVWYIFASACVLGIFFSRKLDA